MPTRQHTGTYVLPRWPQTDDELWWFTQAMWGIRIPRVKVCPNHCAPFDAFADAFFARHATAVWKASRGFGGKTRTLATLTNTEAVCLDAESSILGGSGGQSLNIYAAGEELWANVHAPKQLLKAPPTKFDTYLTNGAHIRAQMASQTSVRGAHPQRLRMDEIDEMDLGILDAATGQPMRKYRNGHWIETQTVMSSTHQYPDKTMSAILERAKEKNWPVYEWCWRESSNPIDGWLSLEEVERKKSEVTQHMWETEYDLQEPSFEGRAIDGDAVEAAFSAAIDSTEDDQWESTPAAGERNNISGVDWAKERDWTVIVTFNTTNADQWSCNAVRRVQRLPWPVMIDMALRRLKKYPGYMGHDATGLGNVINDTMGADLSMSEARRFHGVVMSAGRARQDLFNEYISAIENGQVIFPRIEWLYNEHKYVTLEDLYKPSGHPPDGFVACAIAWSMRKQANKGLLAAPVDHARGASPWDMTASRD